MSENKITIAINVNQTKKGPAHVEGMIALKKIQNYSYALTDEIGLGFSSHVYRGKNDQNNEQVAIKVIDLKKQDQLSKQLVNEEINILEAIKLRNPQNLLKLYDVFKTKNNLYLITEFCEGKDVAKLLRKKKKLGQVVAQSILKQLLNAYQEIYQLAIVHRDLKLANIFIKKGVIKLADFGFAISSQKCQNKFEYNVGSPYYMPPESLKYNKYSYKSDVWSMGILAYEMIYGKLPWKEKVESILYEKITTTPVTELFDSDVPLSEHYKHFIISCLQIDYEKRATPEFIINYEWPQAEPYVQGVDQQATSFRPLSLVKIQTSVGPPKPLGALNSIEQIKNEKSHDKIFRVQHQNSLPTYHNQRDKSPTSRGQFIAIKPEQRPPSNYQQPIKYKTTFRQNTNRPHQNLIPEPMFGGYQEGYSPQNLNAQQSIHGVINFCRFMSNLYDVIDQTKTFVDNFCLKYELASKIIHKSEDLLRLVQGQNILGVEGFNGFKLTERWSKLKQVILKYDRRYKQRFYAECHSEELKEVNDQNLYNCMKSLKINISYNYFLLEELTYYFQLKDLERRQSLLNFTIFSKIDLLSNRRVVRKVEYITPLLCQRLKNRLGQLGV